MGIKKLSKQLLNQIAAGEVVERPASVVKELLENAVDSGASSITLEIEKSGKSLIKVCDNGSGIKKEELPLAIEAHATSKIATLDDLENITTLGFRGEALASISSVSKLCLTSKRAEDENAFAIFTNGLEKDSTIYPAAHPNGTTVEVSELFFNTPARRRFLKSDKTEFFHIKDIFIKTALANLNIQFEFIADGKSVMFLKAVDKDNVSDVQKRIAKLCANDFFNEALYVEQNATCLYVKGYILPPPLMDSDSASDNYYLFLNGRPIADKVILHALKQAYITIFLRPCPVRAVLYLNVAPRDVDVNVHPRKDEVRFHEQRMVHDKLLESLCLVLNEYKIQQDIKQQSQDIIESPFLDNTNSVALDPFNLKDSANNATLKNTLDPNAYNLNEAHIKKDDKASLNCNKTFQSIETNPIQDSKTLDFLNQDNIAKATNVPGVFNLSDFTKKRSDFENIRCDSTQGKDFNNINEPNREDNLPLNINYHAKSSDIKDYATGYASKVENENRLLQLHDSSIAKVCDIQSNIYKIQYLGYLLSKVIFLKYQDSFFLIKASSFIKAMDSYDYTIAFSLNKISMQKLMIPFELKLKGDMLKTLKLSSIDFLRLGFDFSFKVQSIVVKSIPKDLQGLNLISSLLKILSLILEYKDNLSESLCPHDFAYKLFMLKDETFVNESLVLEYLQKYANIDFLKMLLDSDKKEVDIASLALDLIEMK